MTKLLSQFLKPAASIWQDKRGLAGLLLFLCALVFYYFAVLHLDLHKTAFLDLGPYPDACEYFAQANSLLKTGKPTIQIGYERLPSRYPPGYPILMIPWLKVLPHKSIMAPFRTNQTIGLFLLVGSFALYLRMGKMLSGGLAAVLLSTQPAFVTYSRSSMSDLSSAAAAALAFALVYLGLASRRRWLIYASAVVLGLSLLIKPQMLFFAPLLISMALFPRSTSRLDWLLNCVAVLFVYALAISPYFVFNSWQFGHPLKTGYDFWVSDFSDNGPPFSIHNFPQHLAMIRSELTLSRSQFGVANLFGTGTYLVPTFVLLAIGALPFLRLTPFVISALLAGTVFCLATAAYGFADGRFYVSAQFLLVPLAILPVEWALARYSVRRYAFVRIAILVAFVLSCLGYPSESGFKPRTGRFQAWDVFRYPNGRQRSRCYEAEEQFSRTFKSEPGVVLSDIDPVYLNTLLPAGFVAAPLDGDHSYCYSRYWRYGTPEARRLVSGAIVRKEPIYALLAASQNPDTNIARLPSIDGYKWTFKTRAGAKAIVMVLMKNPATTYHLSARTDLNRRVAGIISGREVVCETRPQANPVPAA